MLELDPLELSPTLWQKLPEELANKVLNFLLVDKLIDTLRKVLSHRNLEQLLQCHTFSQIFGHGKNFVSSYGFVTLSKPHKVLRLFAFKHESMQWWEFPKKVHLEVNNSKFIPEGSDGLLLLYTSKKSSMTNVFYRIRHQDYVYYFDTGIWNPLFGSFKWLPEHPRLTKVADPVGD